MTKRALHIDVETQSAIDLTKVGMYNYAAEPSTRVLLVAAAFDDDPVECYDLTSGPMPEWLAEALVDPDVRKLAWNAPFEYEILSQGCANGFWGPLDRAQWWDVMAMARSLSFPGTLAEAGERVGIQEDKRKFVDGKRLIRKFCGPHLVSKTCPSGWYTRETDPDDWARFIEYNVQDVVTEREIFHRLRPYLSITQTPFERKLWLLDQKINETGLPIDRTLVDSAIDVHAGYTEELQRRIARITHVENVNSVQQIRVWLEQQGIPLADLTKETVRDTLLRDDLPGDVREVLRLWQEASKSSSKKFLSFRSYTGNDARLRGSFIYYGASRTGRWAGAGVQPHNLPGTALGGDSLPEMQNRLAIAIQTIKRHDWRLLDIMYPSVSMALTSTVRCAIRAPRGRKLVVADLASIETVVIGWAAQCGRILDLFRTGKDAYKDFATEVFSVPYSKVTKAQRKFCKPPVLGCGFMLGGDGLVAYAAAMGVDLAEMFIADDVWSIPDFKPDDAVLSNPHALLSPENKARGVGRRLVNVYRDAYVEVPRLWSALKFGAFRAVREHTRVEAGPVVYEWRKPFLFCHLPSGRALAYFDPKLEERDHPRLGKVLALTYQGVHQKTRRWETITTHPGKLTENVVQAIARDILAHGLMNADEAGFEIVGHVHDEAITLTDVSNSMAVKDLIDCLTDVPKWAKGMPVGAAGWEGDFYLKD